LGIEKVVINHVEMELICFTDGSCINNGKKNARAGYAVVWPFDCTLNVSKKLSDEPNTNNRAELHAVLCALRQADQIDPGRQRELFIYTDSELVIKTATKWLPGWIKNDFKTSKKQPVANQDLVKDLAKRLGLRTRVRFEHVKAHTQADTFEAKFNAEADRLAREAAEL
jgi:ribonuclease HI